MHVIQLKLKTTKPVKDEIERRFYAMCHIHNVLVKHAKCLLHQLDASKGYQMLKQEYIMLLQKGKLSKEETARKKALSLMMSGTRKDMGLSEYAFQFYIKTCAKQFSKMLSSQQVQKEATRVWKGVEKVLFSTGRDIHYKKYMDFGTIGSKSNKNGVRFYKETCSITWNRLSIQCKMPKGDDNYDYVMESLAGNISYCEVKRMMFPNGWHYYVLVYVKGDAPEREISGNREDIGYSTTGIDPGVSTIAAVSGNKVILEELAPCCVKYNKKIISLQKKMERSKRLSNPGNYNPDGTVRKGASKIVSFGSCQCKDGIHLYIGTRKKLLIAEGCKKKWKFTKAYIKMKRRIKSLYRQKSAYIKSSHRDL